MRPGLTADWRNSLRSGLVGRGSHIEPVRALAGLTDEVAALEPPGGLHTVHRLLHHIVYWQDLLLAAATPGRKVVWPEGPEDWNSPVAPWHELVERFAAGLARADQLAARVDLESRIPAWDSEMTSGGVLTALITHNSYHIAQVVDARRATGHWPPPG